MGKTAPAFSDASLIAAVMSDAGYPFDMGEIYYNKYFTPVKYELNVIPLFNKFRIEVRFVQFYKFGVPHCTCMNVSTNIKDTNWFHRTHQT